MFDVFIIEKVREEEERRRREQERPRLEMPENEPVPLPEVESPVEEEPRRGVLIIEPDEA